MDELSHMNPYTYNIVMHNETAKEKGLKDGDLVELETVVGRKVEGRLKVLTGIHPKGSRYCGMRRSLGERHAYRQRERRKF